MLNTIKAFLLALPLTAKLLLGGILLLAACSGVFYVYERAMRAALTSELAILAKEKRDAEINVIKLEGVVSSLYTQVSELNAQILIVNGQLLIASEKTHEAKIRYIEVRNPDRPVFVSHDNDGKVAELTRLLDLLYPDNIR